MKKYQEEILLCRALKTLDKKLAEMHVKPFTLNVCGGFALLLQKIRKNVSDYTDVDYIGGDMPNEIKKVIDEVGKQYNLGAGWINNDILMAGSSLEELEYATGKLHFQPKMQLSVIKVNALVKEDLLRMKVIAVDTSLSGAGFGGDFTRMKDFPDIELLIQDMGVSLQKVKKICEPYLMMPETMRMIEKYLNMKNKDKAMAEILNDIKSMDMEAGLDSGLYDNPYNTADFTDEGDFYLDNELW